MSLPNVTYGWDVMCYIANRRHEGKKQFKEIRIELEGKGIEISDREVGRLYRKMQALLLGNQVMNREKLTETVEKYGQLIMEVDGLQPDGHGPKLYVLHELLGGTVLSVVQLEQANTENLGEWLEPYREWGEWVKATLSDNEKALVAALKGVWPQAKHQVCQMHFVKNLSEPVHDADRALQKEIRDAMGKLPPVPMPIAESGEESTSPEAELPNDEAPSDDLPAPISPAVMQAVDIISGVPLATLDGVTPQQWEALFPAQVAPMTQATLEATIEDTATEGLPPLALQTAAAVFPDYLSVTASVAWLEENVLAQIPTSARPLVVAAPSKASVTYWEHIRYRQAIQDARWLGSRKPFLCGGLRSYEQLCAINLHLAARQSQQGLDPYLSSLHDSVQRAVTQTAALAADVGEAKQRLMQVERLLADTPPPDGAKLPSAMQRKRMADLLKESQNSAADNTNPTLQTLHDTWSGLLDRWGDDLYHCYDIDDLPRSNLGMEALFGQARRQQRRLNGQSNTSDLSLTGHGYLRVTSASQDALMEMVCHVPAWV